MTKTSATEAMLSPDLAEQALDHLSHAFVNPLRSPILHTPDEIGLSFEEVTFPSADGVPLEGWFIPADTDRIVIANHPMGFNRSGLPSHLEPWLSIWGPSGNDFEVNFVPDYRILHHAGYNVLAYDLRNMGLSGAANGGGPLPAGCTKAEMCSVRSLTSEAVAKRRE